MAAVASGGRLRGFTCGPMVKPCNRAELLKRATVYFVSAACNRLLMAYVKALIVATWRRLCVFISFPPDSDASTSGIRNVWWMASTKRLHWLAEGRVIGRGMKCGMGSSRVFILMTRSADCDDLV